MAANGDDDDESEQQDEHIYNSFLPYFSDSEKERHLYFEQIKENICKGIILLEEQCKDWFIEFHKYLKFYKRRLSKEEHILFITVFFEFIFSEQINILHEDIAFRILHILLKKPNSLNKDDLTVDWQRIYKFCESKFDCKNARIPMKPVPPGFKNKIFILITYFRDFFPIEATQQILDQFLPHLCPFHDSEMEHATQYLLYFLPTKFRQSEFDRGWKLWFSEVIGFVTTFQSFKSWEANLMRLLSRLSNHAIGYIDWTVYVPQIFAGLHKIVFGGSVWDIDLMCTWIVSMIGNDNRVVMDHIKQLIHAVEKYCYPIESESAAANSHILTAFTGRLVDRLHKERYRKRPLVLPIPEVYKITDSECKEMVTILMPVLLKAMFSSILSSDAEGAFHNLALICPQIVCDQLKETFFVSVETVTEPHRLQPSIDCLTAVARSMIEICGSPLQSDIIRILKSCLLAIDINDSHKTTAALNLIQAISVNVPFREEPFRHVAIDFISRVFNVIDNSDPDVWTKTEGFEIETRCGNEEKELFELLNQTFKVIIIQCSPEIFNAVIHELYSKIANAIYDTSVCGDQIGSFCRSCVQVDPENTLALFFPHFSKLVIELTEDPDSLQNENIDKKLKFALCIVSKLCSIRAKHLMKYKGLVFKIVERGVHFNSKYGNDCVSALIRRILVCSTIVWTFDFKSPVDNNWGKGYAVDEVNINWSVPDDDDYQFVQHFVDTYLRPELIAFEKWRNNEISMKKEECRKRLNIINDFIYGLCTALPMWKCDVVQPIDTCVPINIETFKEVSTKDIHFKNGDNIREVIATELRKILSFLKSKRENDTKSFLIIIDSIEELLFDFGATSEIKYVTPVLQSGLHEYLKNRLVERSKAKIRFTIVRKVLMQHEYRLVKRFRGHQFTTIHRDLTTDLISLSTCIYKSVARKAAKLLRHIIHCWPSILMFVVSEITKIMGRKEMTSNEFEGLLYLLIYTRVDNRSLLFAVDWQPAKELWLSLLKTKYTYKEAIIQSFNSISNNFSNFYGGLQFAFNVSTKCISESQKLKSAKLSESEIISSQKAAEERLRNNITHFRDLVAQVVELVDSHKLHWKYCEIAVKLLSSVIREDVPYPICAIKTLLANLNNELLVIRKLCISAVGYILQQQKRKHPKKKVNEFDNQLLQYQLNVDYLDEKVWNSTIFVEKMFWCFYKFPKYELFVYEDASKQPKVNRDVTDLAEEEKIIFEFFTNIESVNKLINFLSLEEKKGKDKFSGERFFLFKRLSRNFGFNVFDKIVPKILDLVSHPNESKQRCASEIITGLVRGSKHWPLNDVRKLRDFLSPVIKEVFKNMTQETSSDWSVFCATCFDDRDTRKFCWFVDLVIENSMAVKKQVFYNAMSIECLILVLKFQSWRSLFFLQRIIPTFELRLSDDFREIRIRVAHVLQNAFKYDLKAFENTLKCSPKNAYLIERALPQLLDFNRENVTETERKKCLNKIKTICAWIELKDSSPYPIEPHCYLFVPILCDAQRETKDVEISVCVSSALTILANTVITESSTSVALQACKEVISRKYWNSRWTVSQFLNAFIHANFFRLNTHAKTIVELVLRLLEDENVDVRNATMVTFITCIETSLVYVSNKLISEFMQKTKQGIAKKHAGYLALCSIVAAYPFDVPSFVPFILVYLSERLNEVPPIPATIKKTFRDFRLTHLDNWREHKEKFTDEQLKQLNDVLISANYYS